MQVLVTWMREDKGYSILLDLPEYLGQTRLISDLIQKGGISGVTDSLILTEQCADHSSLITLPNRSVCGMHSVDRRCDTRQGWTGVTCQGG